jgi:hypothetical protein
MLQINSHHSAHSYFLTLIFFIQLDFIPNSECKCIEYAPVFGVTFIESVSVEYSYSFFLFKSLYTP